MLHTFRKGATTFDIILVQVQRVTFSDWTLKKLLKDEAPALLLFPFTNAFYFSHLRFGPSKGENPIL